MQHIEPLPVFLFPIKLALVVLRAERREQPLGVLAATNDGARLGTRLARRALSKDELLLLLLSWSRRRRRGEEGADVTKGEADARAALLGIFGFFRTLVRVHAVHPARVGLEAQDEERVVRQRDALCRTPHPRRAPTFAVAVAVAVERSMLARAGDVLLRPERHGTPRAEREVYDARAAHDVDCLVRVLGDVVCACAVELDEHVVDWVMQCLLDVCADRGHRGRECVQRRRFVGWVAVDWVAVHYARRRRERER